LSYQVNNCYPNINIVAEIPDGFIATISIIDASGESIAEYPKKTGSVDLDFTVSDEGTYTVTVIAYIDYENPCDEYSELIDHYSDGNNTIVENQEGEITYSQFLRLINCSSAITTAAECIAITYELNGEQIIYVDPMKLVNKMI